MEADIVKHVHVHKETDSKTVVPGETDKPMETVETVETAHFTRSRAKTKSIRTNRLPRSVSNNIDYVHQDEQSDSDKSPSLKRKRNTRPKREPSSSRIKADSFIMKNPSIQPLHKSTRLANSQKEATSNKVSTETGTGSTTPVSTATTSDTPVGNNSKGTFTTQSYNLKKSKKPCKIGCKMCDTVCNSNKELTLHHQQKHNILYCEEYSKAFNNPSSLPNTSIHTKSHVLNVPIVTEFAFKSNLKTHRISHRTLATHCCVHLNCQKCFKNKGDLTRHVKEHDGVLHECPDCPYKKKVFKLYDRIVMACGNELLTKRKYLLLKQQS